MHHGIDQPLSDVTPTQMMSPQISDFMPPPSDVDPPQMSNPPCLNQEMISHNPSSPRQSTKEYVQCAGDMHKMKTDSVLLPCYHFKGVRTLSGSVRVHWNTL